MIEGWRPFTANATPYGLVMLVAYARAVVWCFRAANRGRPRYGQVGTMPSEHRLWQAIAVLLAVLAVYRQFDLTELLTGLGRAFALHGKWYTHRRPFQLAMVWATAVTVIAVAAVLFRSLSSVDPLILAAMAACTALVLLFGINVLSLHMIDNFLHTGYHRIDVYNLIEAGSLATILAASRMFGQLVTAADRANRP